ncbi:hypothetical protein PO909_026319 [Leuciscus waleckii]
MRNLSYELLLCALKYSINRPNETPPQNRYHSKNPIKRTSETLWHKADIPQLLTQSRILSYEPVTLLMSDHLLGSLTRGFLSKPNRQSLQDTPNSCSASSTPISWRTPDECTDTQGAPVEHYQCTLARQKLTHRLLQNLFSLIGLLILNKHLSEAFPP